MEFAQAKSRKIIGMEKTVNLRIHFVAHILIFTRPLKEIKIPAYLASKHLTRFYSF